MALKIAPRGTESAGQMREVVSILRVDRTPDGAGGFETAETELLTVRCSVTELSRQEVAAHRRPEVVATHKLVMRYTDQIKPTMIADWNGLRLRVEHVSNRDARKQFTTLSCVEETITS